MLEPLQVVRYHPGEKYEAHHDLFDLCDFPQKPRRHLTFLIYLNNLPEVSILCPTSYFLLLLLIYLNDLPEVSIPAAAYYFLLAASYFLLPTS